MQILQEQVVLLQDNTAVGINALFANTTASSNTAVGKAALTANTTGTRNVAVGFNALDANTTASETTAIGWNALGVQAGAGGKNVAVGDSAMIATTTGAENAALGNAALNQVTTGNYNTGVGRNAGNTTTTGSNNTLLGYDAEASSATVSNEITLGNGSTTKVRMGNGDVIYGGAMPAFSARASATQSIADNTATTIAFNTEIFDTNSNYDTGTYRFTPTVAGYYQFNAHVQSGGSANTEVWFCNIKQNGTEVLIGSNGQTKFASVGSCSNVSGILYMNGSSDYVESVIYQRSGGGALSTQADSIATSNFSGSLVRAA